ncbi:MAG TPA: hypothetical protein VMW63_01230 [Methanoregulaceae archaeon]|nr:hypothetical protein [Methanoregulaceae archaeon]
MTPDLTITEDLVKDLLESLAHPNESVREAAIEALAISTSDEDWRPNELIRQGGIAIIIDLLSDGNLHIVGSALDILIAVAASGEEESLINAGLIARLYTMREHNNPFIQKKVREALWLLEPQVEETVTAKPQDEY